MLISSLIISILLVLLNIFIIILILVLVQELIKVRADVEILKEFQAKDIADYLYKKGFTSEAVNSVNFQEYVRYRKERDKNV